MNISTYRAFRAWYRLARLVALLGPDGLALWLSFQSRGDLARMLIRWLASFVW